MVEFKDRLTEARLRLKLSGAKLGEQIGDGVSRQLVNHWEKGRNEPSLSQLRRLCEVLNVTAEWLVFGRGDEAQISPEAARLAHAYDKLHGFVYVKSPKDREKRRDPNKKEG